MRITEVFTTLNTYFSFPFVQYAMICGVLIALCSSLLGVTLVLKRFSFIGDGLSHVAFGALSVATVLHLSNNTIIILPVTILAAILLLRTGQNAKIKGDAAIALISVSSLALGYLIVNLFSASANISGDVCSTLFGSTSILTLTKTDVFLCVVLSVVVIAIFILFYHKIFSVTFDENFSRATGVKAGFYNGILAVLTALTVVVGMKMMGALLISSLIIFPCLSSMRICKKYKKVVLLSAIISIVCFMAGITVSFLKSTPAGASVVCANIIVFAVFSGISALKKIRK